MESYETELSAQSASKTYFRRVVLAAEIISKLYEEPTLGRIKFQKLVYFCEHNAGMNLQERYSKQAAGPFDNKFMHSIAKEFKKNKWFTETKVESKGITRTKYLPLENCDGYKKYYQNYFVNEDENTQYIIELFRKTSTDFTELATTVFACFNELSLKSIPVQNDELLSWFYECIINNFGMKHFEFDFSSGLSATIPTNSPEERAAILEAGIALNRK